MDSTRRSKKWILIIGFLTFIILPSPVKCKSFETLYSSSQCGTLPKNLKDQCQGKKGSKEPFRFGVLERKSSCTDLDDSITINECRDSIQLSGYFYFEANKIRKDNNEEFGESSDLANLRKLGWQSGTPLDTCKAIKISRFASKRLAGKFSDSCRDERIQATPEESANRKKIVRIVAPIAAIAILVITVLWIEYEIDSSMKGMQSSLNGI